MSRLTSPLLACVLCCALLGTTITPARAQQPPTLPQTQTPAPPDGSDEVVRITTNLVQFDAVVTDKGGRQITDLRPDEFEVYEDGRLQPLTNAAYVSLQRGATASSLAAPRTGKGEVAAPPMPNNHALRPEQVRRTIALVIDDLGLSFESMANVRAAAKKFVDEQMQPGDLVAVLRTSAGLGSLQQFTTDKRLLNAAIERVRWYPLGRGGVGAFGPVTPDVVAEAGVAADTARKLSGNDFPSITSGEAGANANALREIGNEVDRYREELFSVGTLGALNFVVKGLRTLPGRKSAILFSDGISILQRDAKSQNVLESLRRLVELATRASVVVYTMDARGLSTLTATAQDNFGARNGAELRGQLDDRAAGFFESKNGLNYLAQQTGGFFIENDNDLSVGVRRILDDQKGFYLIAYRPTAQTFDRQTGRLKFNSLEVKVKRLGLRVRTRNGFYGVPDTEARAARPASRAEQLYAALSSPFAAGDVSLRLTSLYAHDAQAGDFVRSLIYVSGQDLTFKEAANAQHEAELDVLALTYGEAGQTLDEANGVLTWSGDEAAYQRARVGGLVFVFNVPVKKPGPYQLRLAIRDTTTKRIGATSQFIEVPDLGDGRLALSGLVLSASATATTATASHGDDVQSGPAVRRVPRGAELFYNFAIYNAPRPRAGGATATLPALTTQVRLFRDGREIYLGKSLPVEPGAQADATQLLAGGRLKLSPHALPGNYVLQVVVADARTKGKPRAATQLTDFEIVN